MGSYRPKAVHMCFPNKRWLNLVVNKEAVLRGGGVRLPLSTVVMMVAPRFTWSHHTGQIRLTSRVLNRFIMVQKVPI